MGRTHLERGLSGASKLLYDKLLELVLALSPGAPLPPMRMMKDEFGVGYAVLKRALDALEKEGRVLTRGKKGIFAASPAESHLEGQVGVKDSSTQYVPWGGRDGTRLKFMVRPSWMGTGLWRELVDAYNRSNPLRTVELVPMPGGANKELPDFDLTASSSHLGVSAHIDTGRLLDLSPFADAEKPELPLHEHAWGFRPGGVLKGVGPIISMTTLAYRRELFKRRATAFERPAHSDLLGLLSGAKKSLAERNGFVFLGYMSFFFRHDVSLLGKDKRAVSFRASKVARVLEFLHCVSVEKKLSPFCSDTYHIYENPELLTRRSAALTECHVAIPFPADSYGFSPMPLEPGGVHPLFMPLLMISADSFYPEDAWSFIAFVLSEQGQRIVAKYPFGLPAAQGIVPNSIPKDKLDAMLRSVENGTLAYADSDALYHARFIIEMLIEKWLKGGIDMKALCAEIEERVTRFMHSHNKSFSV